MTNPLLLGMIHGRFQPFHLGHLEYLRAAAARCKSLVVGITNADAGSVAYEAADPARSTQEANPFSYVERYAMLRAVLRDEGLDGALVVPFPIACPELWSSYVPSSATHLVRVFDAWGNEKVDRLRRSGHAVIVLDAGAKGISGHAVRASWRSGGHWRELVPAGVAGVIDARDLRRPA